METQESLTMDGLDVLNIKIGKKIVRFDPITL